VRSGGGVDPTVAGHDVVPIQSNVSQTCGAGLPLPIVRLGFVHFSTLIQCLSFASLDLLLSPLPGSVSITW
ncbi:hypothetical protein, partial [Bacillus altitudinis]|uniref:hypothetical protein n=1 Tax=Bacillus altitudinis TaxID=293387 RepID=UPI003314ACD5